MATSSSIAADVAPPPPRSGVARYISAEVVNAAASLFGVVAFTHVVSRAEYGAYSVAMAASGVISAICGEWLQASILRFGPEARGVAGRDAIRRVLLHHVLGASACALAGAAVWAIAAPTTEWRWLAVLSGVLATLTLMFLALTALLQAAHRSRAFAWLRSAYSSARVILALAAGLLLERSARGLMAGTAFALLVLVPLALHRTRGALAGDDAAPADDAALARRFRRFGLPLVTYYAASQTLNLADRFLLQYATGSENVAIYSVAYALAMGIAVLLLQPLLSASYPRVVARWGAGDARAALGELEATLTLGAMAAPLVMLGVAAFGGPLIALITPKGYEVSWLLLLMLAVALVCWQLTLTIQKVLELRLRSNILLGRLWIAAIVNVAANVALVGRFGIYGAAFATLLAYGLYAALIWLACPAALRPRIPARVGAHIGLACVPFALVALLAARLGPLPRLLLGAPLAVGAYILVLRRFGHLPELREWRRLLPIR